MRILLVSYFFPPTNVIGAVRVGKFARYLHENNHDVHVLAANDTLYPTGLPLEIPTEKVTYTTPLQINALPYRIIGQQGLDSQRNLSDFPAPINWLGRLYKLLFNFPDGQVGWLRGALKEGCRLVRDWRPDVIYASAMPFTSLIVAKQLSQKFGVPFVGELRDLWVDSHYYSHPRWRKLIEDRLERATLSRAAALVTVSEPLADVLREKYGIPTSTIFNGFDPDNFPEVTSIEGADDDIVRIVYTGMIYPGRRNPSPLFEALRTLGDDRHRFRIEFYGRMLPDVRKLAESYGIDDVVELHSAVPYSDAVSIQAKADVLLLLLWDTPAEFGVYTGKLFEYLGARRPILCVGMESGVASELIHTRGAGIVSNDPAILSEQLMKWSRQKMEGGIAALPLSVRSGFSRSEQFSLLVSALKRDVPFEWSSRINIRFVINQLGLGGTERHLIQVLPKLDRHRFNISVQTIKGGGRLEDTFRRVGIPVFSPNPALPTLLQRVWAFVRITGYIYCNRPNIVHFFLPEAYLLGGLASILVRQPTIIMSRRNLNIYQHRHRVATWFERWMHKRTRALIGNSRAVVSELAAETCEISKVGLIYSGVDLKTFTATDAKDEVRSAINVSQNALVIVIVANLIPYKGHADLIAALSQIKDELPQPWVLLCIGRDEGIGCNLKMLAESFGMDDNIRWLGEEADVRPYLTAADIGILCSHEEGFSNSILEGMAYSLPMIVTSVGGNPEAVVHDVTGVVVPPYNPDALAHAIVQLALNPAQRARMGEAARCRVAREFSLERCVASYMKLYESLVDTPARPISETIGMLPDLSDRLHHDT